MAVTMDLLNPVDLACQVGDGRHHGSPEPCGPGLSGCNGRHHGSPEPCGPGLSGW